MFHSPSLFQSLPAVGKLQTLPPAVGSSDAVVLAQAIRLAIDEKRLTCIICEDAQQANRLADELHDLVPEARIALFPDWETLPYDAFSPHQDLISDRLATLYGIMRNSLDIVLLAASTALQRLTPPTHLAAHTFWLKKGDTIDVKALRAQLALAGYTAVTQVMAPGEFSVRGGLIDLYPMGAATPYRLDLFDDELETLRTFDVDSQRSLATVSEIRMLPAREYPLDDSARHHFRQAFREAFEGDPSRSLLYKDISAGGTPSGLEYYLPLFFTETATLFDYLPPTTLLVLHGDVNTACTVFWQELQRRYLTLRGDPQRPLLPPVAIYQPTDKLQGACKAYARLSFAADASPQFASLPPLAIDRRAKEPFAQLQSFIDDCAKQQIRVLMVAESAGRRETMQAVLREGGLQFANLDKLTEGDFNGPRGFAVASLAAGFIWPAARLALLTEHELYADAAKSALRRRKSRSQHADIDAIVRDLAEIRIGDPVVHEQHGIGRYQGLTTIELEHGSEEFLHLEYAKKASLYVPVSDLFLISRYSGANPESVALHELGSGQWERARKKAAEKVFDTAAELLNIYAQRAARQGHAFTLVEDEYERFAEGFAFEPTPDQQAAIDAVLADLAADKPMDRLVCGDVGFGKTEVALRAAFAVISNAYQVALLVPTTLLAEQHYKVFSDRFSDLPVRIAELSRFRTSKETKATLAALESGGVDLVIGTHKLLQGDVRFRKLGLVIIDEEHRFGVRQKEQLKKLRAEVDVLTLTATPIPRTLSMSLEGLRDFSVIATAPEKRLSIKTFVAPYSLGILREAMTRELNRGGQIYFLHNDVQSLPEKAQKISELMPEARLGIAHGQMPERQLEQVMRDFYQQRINVLVCSTIIETGIDVPTANTIIIERADKFGLAQLHQLRGRVGRSHHQAYAYLLTPDEEALTAQAKKRLDAIRHMEQLGSGFYLAMHDLEIRGAGELLGDEQSGEIAEIGFQLYADMLKHAVDALKEGREPDLNEPLRIATEIRLHHPALLPESYCSNVHERLVLYKRLASAGSDAQLDALHEELIDRFGLLPPEAKALLACHRLRLLVKPFGVNKLDVNDEAVFISFVQNPPFDPGKLIRMIQSNSHIRFASPNRIRIEQKTTDPEEVIGVVKKFLQGLSG